MRKTVAHHSVSGEILHALGKGFSIACAGMLIGAVFGNPALIAGSTWGLLGIVGVGAIGTACMFGAAAAHRSCLASDRVREPSFSESAASVKDCPNVLALNASAVRPDATRPLSSIEGEDEAVSRFVAELEEERMTSTLRGRAH